MMHPYNELTFRLNVDAISPLLIKEGRYTETHKKTTWSGGLDEVKNRMPNVIPISRATEDEIKKAVTDPAPLTAVGKLSFFVPGSSMRGAWRSHLERILRSFETDTAKICDPLEEDEREADASCSRVLTLCEDLRVPYSQSCPVCRLFGSTMQASRISIGDGEVDRKQPGRLVQREHVRINRRTGAVGGAPLKFFALQETRFHVDVRLRNFELSHVVMLGMLLTDLKLSNVPLGSGKNKGYGKVRATVDGDMTLTCFGLERPPDTLLRGVAEHPVEAQRKWFQDRYHVVPQNPLQLPAHKQWSPDKEAPWRFHLGLSFDEFDAAWRTTSLNWSKVPALAARCEAEVQ